MEIERQWLINRSEVPYDLDSEDIRKRCITQMYLNFDPEIRIRAYENEKRYTLTIKTGLSEDGLTRAEVEKEITEAEYRELEPFKKGISIEKTRYVIPDERYEGGKYIQEIDIFHGELEGLCALEVEFSSEEEAAQYVPHPFVLKEVTSDIRYKNCYIAGSSQSEREELLNGH